MLLHLNDLYTNYSMSFSMDPTCFLTKIQMADVMRWNEDIYRLGDLIYVLKMFWTY